jgi:ubiquinone/menaquinone biosynthesis C-methylase UbiE
VPDGANLGLGCGAPIAALDLRPGEVVLDLGSGAGFDAILAARKVGPEGRVIGVDMTPEMLAKALANAAEAGLSHVEFRAGRLEALPVADRSVDAVTSNCVINLVPDKRQVFREVARVLRPGGRVVVSDIILDDALPASVAGDLLAYVGCVAGAMHRDAYFALVREAGLGNVEILKDIDYMATAKYAIPEDLQGAMGRAGLRPADLTGKVRSITWRAGV